MNKKIVLFTMISIAVIYFVPAKILSENKPFITSKNVVFSIETGKTNTEDIPLSSLVTTNEGLRPIYVEIRQNAYQFRHHPENISFDKLNYGEQMKYLKKHHIINTEYYEYCMNKELQEKGVIKAERVEDVGMIYTLQFYTVHQNDKTYRMFQETNKYKFVDISMPIIEEKNEKEQQELLQNYIKYLGLDYLDDWIYMENSYCSAHGGNAQVSISQKGGVLRLWLQVYYGYL